MLRSSETLGGSWLHRWALAVVGLSVAACGQGADHAPPAAEAVVEHASDTGHTTESGGDLSCAGTRVQAHTLPVDVFAVLDGSSSMSDATESGVSKWYATKSAFEDFLSRAPEGMGFGLSLFPLRGDAGPPCSAGRYREAALPIQDVSQMARAATARLDAVVPGGPTPTAPAFAAALEMAVAHGLAHPERAVVVVLATDGLPTTCAPTDAAALAALAKDALNGPANVRTLVVTSTSLAAADTRGFERVAVAGGTLRPVLIDSRGDFTQQLGDALDAAAAREVACDLSLPEPPAGERLDYDAVNVVLEGAEPSTVPRVAGASACTSAGGWYYDVEPAQGAPSRLNVCKSSCARTRAATLAVELGCRTVVR